MHLSFMLKLTSLKLRCRPVIFPREIWMVLPFPTYRACSTIPGSKEFRVWRSELWCDPLQNSHVRGGWAYTVLTSWWHFLNNPFYPSQASDIYGFLLHVHDTIYMHLFMSLLSWCECSYPALRYDPNTHKHKPSKESRTQKTNKCIFKLKRKRLCSKSMDRFISTIIICKYKIE